MKRFTLSVAVFAFIFAGVQIAEAGYLEIPCLGYKGVKYKTKFEAYQNPSDSQGIYWKLISADPSNTGYNPQECGTLDDNMNFTLPYEGHFEYYRNPSDPLFHYWKQTISYAGTLYLPCIRVQDVQYKVSFDAYKNSDDSQGTYWKFASIVPVPTPRQDCSILNDDWSFVIYGHCLVRYHNSHDSSGLYWKEIICSSSCPTGQCNSCTDTTRKPYIVNDTVNMPAAVEAEQEFSISFSYNEPDGLSDITEIQVVMSDYPNDVYSYKPTGTGNFTMTALFEQKFAGNQWIEIRIIDICGRICTKRIPVIIRCSVCVTSCTNNHSPYIVNSQVSVNNKTVGNNQQVSVESGKEFGISFSYNDPDGLNDVKEVHLKMSDENKDYKYSPDGSGTFTIGGEFLPPYTGNQWIEVWVVDSCGNKCVVIRIIIIVTVPSCGSDGCYTPTSCSGGVRGQLDFHMVYCIIPPCPGGYEIHTDSGSTISAVLSSGLSKPSDGKSCCFKGYYDSSSKFNVTSYSDCQ